MVTDASFPDRQGLCLREQPCAGLGHFLTGCGTKGRAVAQGSSGPRWPSSCTLEGPGSWSGTGVHPSCFLRLRPQRLGAALIGVLEACRLVSLGLTIVLGVKGLGVVLLAWDFCTPHLLSSVQKP